MKSRQDKLTQWSPAWRWLAVLCLVLVASSAAAQTLHFHADDLAGTSKHCPICPVLHAAVRVPQTVELNLTFRVTGYQHRPAEPGWTVAVDSAPLFSRPPPLA
ncbi:MAG TPA: hypothetical protein VN176_18085 [Verrucomicrobiae bacterium]|nr:hypothetical protein [Verrucomicrobiae bacterium]